MKSFRESVELFLFATLFPALVIFLMYSFACIVEWEILSFTKGLAQLARAVYTIAVVVISVFVISMERSTSGSDYREENNGDDDNDI